MPDPTRLRLGVSACLLGQPVRYDGGHKRDGFVADWLGAHFDLLPVCPEVAIGLGVPRQPIRIVQTAAGLRVRGVHDPTLDVTDALDAVAARVTRDTPDLHGYVLKTDSPSCGMARVSTYTEAGLPTGQASGAYAAGLLARLPLLPVEQDSGLHNPALRENFIERVFAYARWRTLTAGNVSGAALIDFHSRHKYQLLAHNQAAYRRLGPLVARAGRHPTTALLDNYGSQFMAALARLASVGNHVNGSTTATGPSCSARSTTFSTTARPCWCPSTCCGITCTEIRSRGPRSRLTSTPTRASWHCAITPERNHRTAMVPVRPPQRRASSRCTASTSGLRTVSPASRNQGRDLRPQHGWRGPEPAHQHAPAVGDVRWVVDALGANIDWRRHPRPRSPSCPGCRAGPHCRSISAGRPCRPLRNARNHRTQPGPPSTRGRHSIGP